ncbi:MAG: hypothetical protein GF398_02940 [Chitinivibrionales bacterium]|nr:hypothetical protein [Chitinivibrionales bacterium]
MAGDRPLPPQRDLMQQAGVRPQDLSNALNVLKENEVLRETEGGIVERESSRM